MSLDGDVADGAGAEAPAMQLRGGGSVEIVDEEEEGGEGSDAYEAEEDEYDDDEIDEDEVELGLVKPMPANRDEWDIDFAVGKVGGVPRWLDPRAPLAPEDVECATCHQTMALLLQVNSPDDERPHAAARSLYLFACRSPGCIAKDPAQALKVWRTQMESPNAFFPHTDETQTERKRLGASFGPRSQSSSIAPPLTRLISRPQRTPSSPTRPCRASLRRPQSPGPSSTSAPSPSRTRSPISPVRPTLSRSSRSPLLTCLSRHARRSRRTRARGRGEHRGRSSGRHQDGRRPRLPSVPRAA